MAIMSDASSFDPYAPPKADLDGPSRRARATSRLKPGLRKALRRLNEHLSDPARGQNGLWYVYDADLIESAEAD
jgi:hypothetical protein